MHLPMIVSRILFPAYEVTRLLPDRNYKAQMLIHRLPASERRVINR